MSNVKELNVTVDGTDNNNTNNTTADGTDNNNTNNTINTTILIETIRVLVLDCRSGKPIKNARVKQVKRGTTIADASFTADSGKIKDPTGKNGQKALEALNYDCGKKLTEEYGKTGKKAYKKYCEERGYTVNYQEDNSKPTEKMLKKIIKEHNDIRATNEKGIVSIPIPVGLLGKGFNLEIGFHDFPVIVEQLKKQKDSDKSVISRNEENGNPSNEKTLFAIKWGGNTQSTLWGGNFGWKITDSQKHSAEFKVSETLAIPGREFTSFKDLQNEKKCFSKFYTGEKSEPHFVLFALQWCQPVWDDISDPSEDERTNEKVFVSRKIGNEWIKNRNMHIVTTFNGASHYYGFYDYYKKGKTKSDYRSRSKSHKGIDVHSEKGKPCFAIHGGWVSSHGGTKSTAGHFIRLYLNKKGIKPYAQYFHFKEDAKNLDNKHVLAGQIVGKSGRTGYSSIRPSHLHFEIRKSSDSVVEPDKITNKNDFPSTFCDQDNVVCMPSNKIPVLFPCECQYGTKQDQNDCNFSKASVLKECWAVQEYPKPRKLAANKGDAHDTIEDKQGLTHFICPYIFKETQDETRLKARLQAQLKFIYHNKGKGGIPSDDNLKDLEKIDADLGGKSKEAIKGLMQAYQADSDTQKQSGGGATPSTEKAEDSSSLEKDQEEKKIPSDADAQVQNNLSVPTDEQVQAFIELYVDQKKTDDTLVNGAVNWLNTLKPLDK